ncbi:MAG: methyltransferase domain-containing protein [Hyphomicrobium sp.]
MTGLEPSPLSQLPAAYQRWRASELGRMTDRIEAQIVQRMIGPVAGKRVLDVGCGDGELSVRLAQPGAEVTGVDADLRVLAAARNRAAQAGLAIEFIEGDVRQLPISDQTFDIVVAVTVLCFVSDPERAISEITRVLKTGGRLIIGELGRYSLWAVKRRIAGWFGSRTWRAASFLSPRQMQRLVANAGLIVEETRGAIYYPPCNLCAHWLAPFDARISGVTMTGAAFIALAARKP